MHLHKGLTHIQSEIKPQLLSGESFTLKEVCVSRAVGVARRLHRRTHQSCHFIFKMQTDVLNTGKN